LGFNINKRDFYEMKFDKFWKALSRGKSGEPKGKITIQAEEFRRISELAYDQGAEDAFEVCIIVISTIEMLVRLGVSKEVIEHALTSNSDNPRELMAELEKLKNLKQVTKNQNVGNN